MRQQTEIQKLSGVTIRRLGADDTPAVIGLVQLDSADVPRGDLLGAEVEGRLVAVVPIQGGETIADPFSRTSELQALLQLRAAQLRGREPERRRFGGLFARRRIPAAAPSAPSPPGRRRPAPEPAASALLAPGRHATPRRAPGRRGARLPPLGER